ncbi:MAG: Na/Pi cotransporter family protein [Proteobacteria bacterium]|nr:Na/Pi cotransporter family protein [Pseudomonadota bacterium]
MAVLGQIFQFLGSLGIFFYGMKVMSESIQRLTGDRLRSSLSRMTRTRIGGVATGFFVTSIIQSSSATTVMVVSFVNAGLLTLRESIGVIMGANLGTTVTIWVVSLIGFKFKITILAMPAIVFGIPLIFSKNSKTKNQGEVLIGFALLFLGLGMLKRAVPDIKNNPEIMEFLKSYTELGHASILIFIVVGVILTIVVQSSSASTAITVTMAYKGWIDFPSAAAIILGENIGTTITAYLASLAANRNAKRAARAHLLFNVLGVCWIFFLFAPFLGIIDMVVPGNYADPVHMPLHLSAFHTIFNLANICLLIIFVPQIEKLVIKMIPKIDEEKNQEYKLEYFSTGVMATPEIAILEAKKEIVKMAEVISDMFKTYLDVFFNPHKKMGDVIDELKKAEDLTDLMEEEITNYLISCSKQHLTGISVQKVNSRIRIVDELESIADCCYNLVFSVQRRYDKKLEFYEGANRDIKRFADLVTEFFDFNLQYLREGSFTDTELKKAFQLENAINRCRNELRDTSVQRLQKDGQVKAEILFLDILKNFEKIGDYSLNISEAQKQMNLPT